MNQSILEIKDLSKSYKNVKVLDNVGLQIQKGGIYGFIGQNGAGKTTLMRILLGQAFADSGNISLFGKSGENELVETRRKIGAIVETPVFYPNMTAAQNLEVKRLSQGTKPKESITEMLKLVGLENVQNKKVKDFSLGMKQRLGIANALINDPEFLILDEPINGLDPVSIVEIRNLLLYLNKEKAITILISSHILSELYLLVNHYIIIDKGVIIKNLSQGELDASCTRHVEIGASDINAAANVITNVLNTSNFEVVGDTIHLYDFIDDMAKVSEALSKNGIIVTKLAIVQQELEDYFIKLVGGSAL